MRALIAAIFLLLSLGSKTEAQLPTRPFIAQAFHLYSTCSGGDEALRWQIEGWPQLGWNIKGWLPQDIWVFGIGINIFSGDMTLVPSPWWMIGSNFTSGDTILFLGTGEYNKLVWFPPGKTIYIPGTDNPEWTPSRYLDLHGLCFGGGPVNAWITLYYTYDNHR